MAREINATASYKRIAKVQEPSFARTHQSLNSYWILLWYQKPTTRLNSNFVNLPIASDSICWEAAFSSSSQHWSNKEISSSALNSYRRIHRLGSNLYQKYWTPLSLWYLTNQWAQYVSIISANYRCVWIKQRVQYQQLWYCDSYTLARICLCSLNLLIEKSAWADRKFITWSMTSDVQFLGDQLSTVLWGLNSQSDKNVSIKN